MKCHALLVSLVFALILLAGLVSAGFESASNVPVVSEAEGFNRPNGVWVLKYTADGFASDKINALFSKDRLSESGTKAKNDFSIDIAGNVNYCKYDILREAERLDVFTVSVVSDKKEFRSWQYDTEGLRAVQRQMMQQLGCVDLPHYEAGTPNLRYLKEGLITDSIGVFCYAKRDTVAQVGSLQNLKYVTQTTWRVQAAGKAPQEATVSNDGTGDGISAAIGPDVRVRFGGQLSSGETCPITATEMMAYSPSFAGNWRVIDKQNYANYEAYMTSQLEDNIIKVACSEGAGPQRNCPGISRSSAETLVNNLAFKAASERSLSFTPVVEGASPQGGTLRLNLARQIRYPTFTLFVDSDYIEVEVQTGKPQLSCPSGLKYTEGDLRRDQLEVTAKNVGKARGSFELRVVGCSDGLSSGDTDAFTLEAGESQTKRVAIPGQTSAGQTVKGACTVELIETNTKEKQSCNVNVEVTAPATCEEGKKICSFGADGKAVIKQCTNNQQTVIETCSTGQVCDSDGAALFCRAESEAEDTPTTVKNTDECGAWIKAPVTGKTIVPNLWCKLNNFIAPFKIGLAVILGVLAGLLGMSFGYSVTKAFTPKAQWITVLVVGGIVTIAVATLAYLYFWPLLGVLVVVALVRAWVPF